MRSSAHVCHGAAHRYDHKESRTCVDVACKHEVDGAAMEEGLKRGAHANLFRLNTV